MATPVPKAIKSMNDDLLKKAQELSRKHKIDEDRAIYVLDSVDNGDMKITETEFKLADKILKNKIKYASKKGGDYYRCFGWLPRLLAKNVVLAKRINFYKALTKLEKDGWKLTIRQVVNVTEGNIFIGAKVAVKDLDPKNYCNWNTYYETTLEKDGIKYKTVSPTRSNIEMATSPDVAARMLLSAVNEAKPGITGAPNARKPLPKL